MDAPGSAADRVDPVQTARSTAATVCVTGSTGYIGSWLVRSLLRRGYAVHAAARDLEGHVRSNILDPAVRGTLNLLRSCQKAGSVRRVVFTSSISTITARDSSGGWKPTVDESSLVPVDIIWKTKPDGWVYVLSKLLTEEAAFRYTKENGVDLVSVIPTTVAGPFFTPKVPASVRVLLSPITDDPEPYSILVAVHSRLGSISLVHIEDICNAHIFLMEQKAAEGRYICSAGSCVMPQLADMLSSEYPLFTNAGRFKDKFRDSCPSAISSNRLADLGFEFKYGVRDIVRQSVDCCVGCGFLKDLRVNREAKLDQ